MQSPVDLDEWLTNYNKMLTIDSHPPPFSFLDVFLFDSYSA